MTYPTHEVINQPPPLEGHNAYTLDPALGEALAREGAAWAGDELEELGAIAGSHEAIEWGRLANAHFPVLHTHDRFGYREDRIEFHPAYHSLMETAIASGLHAAPWVDGRPGAHVVRAAKFIVWTSVEPGHLCPMSMTYAVVPALTESPELLAEWLPRLASPIYDPAFVPATQKLGITAGMALTEKQGGSDVRANSTVAVPDGEGAYLLTGHKWFVSGTMADVFLALAQAPEGLTCFFLPRWKPDGSKNPFWIQHIKDKMGDRSNATSEVEFADAWALPVGRSGRGVRTIVEMINRTRLDCSLGSAGLMRHGLTQAIHNARHRSAFGKVLRRPVVDGAGARRPGPGIGGRHLGGAPPGRRLRPGGAGRRSSRLLPHRHPGHQVLDLQAQPGALRRGARVPGRQRVRRGLADCLASSARARSTGSGRARAT